jgi:uncharacterized membrane protein
MNKQKNKNWVLHGLLWGGLMFLVMTFIFPLLVGKEINTNNIGYIIIIWALAGLAFGYLMRRKPKKTGKKK